MPRRLRIQDPEIIFHVTNRTQEAKYLFVPDDEFNAIVMRWLRRAVRIFGIELYAAVIMGNHFHLILRAPKMNLHKFMQYFQSNLARAVNRLRKRFDAAVFPRRYAAEPILDCESLEQKLSYVLLNPVAADLVEFPGDYPGYTSWHQSTGTQLPARHSEEPPPITPPPMWARLTADELADAWRRLLRPGIQRHARARTRPVLGAKRVRETAWYRRPRRPKRSRRRPLCHASTKEAWKRYAEFSNRIHTRYRSAVLAWRRGNVASFPHGTLPPGWRECSSEERRLLPREFRGLAA